ncbi:acyl-CoA/acyl-ACP dehydrogenase [Nocardia sp. NBC_00565]|uniref:acyl-CoA dehydrogenase family protein n=1 Tax=Nocardia sp. NBC_00565 TaxID=2975993 RepID=UPI002E81BC35|nr:acyl-CoA dehydrogenase family protein [Nocardia sp. NBC_00565]WUC02745.1 acyl-CoA/acyl-ACP dehydrogenase [Nocardia sp. NBC_00565]
MSAPAIEVPWPRTDPPALTPGPEQSELRAAIRGLLAKHSGIEQVRTAASAELGYSPQLWKTLVDDMSVTTLAVPENRGGLGYGMVELGIVLEECGRALACEPVYTSAVLGVHALLSADPIQDADLLAGVLDGSLLATVSALSATTDHVHAESTRTGWLLHGTATHLVGGGNADIAVVSAQCPDGRRLFATQPGAPLVRTERRVLDPTRRRADLTFDQCPAIALTDVDATEATAARLGELATLALACENTGIVDRLLEMTVEYVRTRHQFGRPIGSFQAVKHRLADLLVTLERARSASRYAAAIYAQDPGSASLAVAVAGAVCTDAAVHAAAEAIQLHGGVGFTWEHPAHSYFRRAMGNEALQGDSRAQRARIGTLIGI